MPPPDYDKVARVSPSPAGLLGLLTEHFGNEADAIHFLRSFSSIAFVIPPMSKLELLLRNKRLVDSIHADPSAKNLRRLANFHGVEMHTLSRLYRQLRGIGLTQRRGQIAPPNCDEDDHRALGACSPAGKCASVVNQGASQ